jgi:dTDP-4-amino-4,6-dideoxygalactose transaminase
MFRTNELFEKRLGDFYGSPYVISVDCCTHALELCLRYQQIKYSTCPTRTYISIPFTFEKLGIDWQFTPGPWYDYYYLGNTNIIDAAVYWKKDGYIPNTLMCLSFQFKKHLNLGRGGAILTDDLETYTNLKKMRYDGRTDSGSWMEQNIDTVGYHYYMTPETAQLGLDRIDSAINSTAKQWSYLDYPNLPHMSVFLNKKH